MQKKEKKPRHLQFLIVFVRICQVDGNIPIWPADLGLGCLRGAGFCILKFVHKPQKCPGKKSQNILPNKIHKPMSAGMTFWQRTERCLLFFDTIAQIVNTSKVLLRTYLDPQNIAKTSEKWCILISKNTSVSGSYLKAFAKSVLIDFHLAWGMPLVREDKALRIFRCTERPSPPKHQKPIGRNTTTKILQSSSRPL